MDFDFRKLEPRAGIQPALKVIVGLIGVLCAVSAAGLLFVLIAEQGARDWSMLLGAGFLALVAWGCAFIAFGKLDETRFSPREPASPRVRVLFAVAWAIAIVQTVLEFFRDGVTTGRILWAIAFSVLLVAAIFGNRRAQTTPGK